MGPERAAELGKCSQRPRSVPLGVLGGFGVPRELKQAAVLARAQNLIINSFLKSAEAAPSGEVLGTGYSICPSRV